ncbi:MAG: MarR family winged helix-turn-helix transcriptional regulator [Acholeplasmataceae bacterium]
MKQRDITFIPVMFHQIQKKMMEKHEKIMETYDLTKKHVPFFMILSKFPDGVTQQELSEKMHMDKGHTSRTLRELEDKGYVEKLGESAYKNKYKISQKGLDVQFNVKKENQEIIKTVLEVLTEEELESFERIMRKITEAI